MLRICLILVATLAASAAPAASIQPAPETSAAISPSIQHVGGASSGSIAEIGAIDRLETASTDGEPAVVSASAFVQTSPSIFQMVPEAGERSVVRRNTGSPRVIRAGAIGGSASAPASTAASSWVEEAPVGETDGMDVIDDMDGNAAYDEPAVAPTDTPR